MTQTRHDELTRPEAIGIIDGFTKNQLLKRLQKLPHGCLLIEDRGEVYSFGCDARLADLKAEIVIRDRSAYRDIVFGGSIGAAEAYMQGKWTSPNLVDLVRLMSLNIDFLNQMDDSGLFLQRAANRVYHWLNRNTEARSRQNISAHYDLSNEFFALFLDPTMMYSSAVFADADADLDSAAVYKLDLVCRKLELKPEDHLLEIGSGWGGMAIHAARHYGCKVTTTTISRQQYEAAREQVEREGLGDRINVLFEDYRNLRGSFDKLVSIEMIEAVGQEYYKDYFRGCSALLKPHGLMLLQAITMPGQRYDYARKSVDFIQRYIFPGGSLPSHEVVMTSVRQYTDLQMVGMQEIGEDYARTLGIWRQRFLDKLDSVRELGFDEFFVRMWNYYLAYCQGAFEERVIGTSQLLFAKPQWRAATATVTPR